MSVREKILAALAKFGPMTTAQLAQHVDCAWLSVACGNEARKGGLIRLGGGKRTSIYGLPGQKAAVAETEAKPKKADKRRSPVKKVQKIVPSAKQPRVLIKPEKDFRATPGARLALGDLALALPPAAAGGFRAAIASDGSMLFLDAKAGAFELNHMETRALIEFVRTLDGGEAGA